MDFLQGLTDELVKLAGEEGDTMYGHGDGKKPSVARGAAAGAAAAGVATHAAGEAVRRHPSSGRVLGEVAKKPGLIGEEAKVLARTKMKPGAFHGGVAKSLPLTMLLGAAGGAGIQGVRRAMHHGEKKEAGLLGHAKPGMLGRMAAKVPKKAVGAAALGGAAYGAGHHRGLKKGEGEAVQVGEQAYGAGARDMENALMSELGIG